MIPATIAIAAECALVALVEPMPVLAKSTTIDWWVAKVAMPVDVWSPASRHIVAACFEPIVETALLKPLVRGRIRPGII